MLDRDQPDGPVMLAVTDIVKPPPWRITGGQRFNLGRSFRVRDLAGAAGGALAGAALAAPPVLAFLPLQFLALAVVLGGALGLWVVNAQPLDGEPAWKWLTVRARQLHRSHQVGGQRVRAYIGGQPRKRLAAGPVQLLGGSAPVAQGVVDGRGAIPARDRREPLGDELDSVAAPR